MKLKLDLHRTPFELDTTLSCGQLFRWKKINEAWYGVVSQKIIRVQQVCDTLEFDGAKEEFIQSYFRLDDNLPKIITRISRDPIVKRATQMFPGLRLVRQEPWECLISYICTTQKNIPAIKKMISNLSRRFGDMHLLDDYEFFTFPHPKAIADASISELKKCQLGFRAKWIRKVAKLVLSGKINFETLEKLNYDLAKDKLIQIPGVGNKVADCVLLFSLDKLEAFPIDIWIQRIVKRYYITHFDAQFMKRLEKASMSQKTYKEISTFAQKYFGNYAGYAQEYLFHFGRSTFSRKSLNKQQIFYKKS